MFWIRWAALASMLVAATSVDAQEKKPEKKPVTQAITVEEAGPDFLVQGEYAGPKLGAQVVALGDGKFDVYFLSGGLPGAGWDQKGRAKVDAKTEGAQTLILGKDYSGSIASGKLVGKGPDGEFALARVERTSKTAGAKPPEGAIILFEGKANDHWNNPKVVEENLLFCGVNCKTKLGEGTLHIEFRTPFQPKARGQGRGNSGVYLLGYEVQVLDSFGLNGEKNECGAYYNKAKPLVNMCYPPLSWQTFDITLKEKDGATVSTVLHNGVLVHDEQELRKGAVGMGVLNLQNHGNYVAFRNIWFAPKK